MITEVSVLVPNSQITLRKLICIIINIIIVCSNTKA